MVNAAFTTGPQLTTSSNFSPSTGGQSPDSLTGMGTYQANGFNIDPNAFNNPLGNTAPALGNAFSNYLGNTTAPVNASTAAGVNSPAYNEGIGGQLGLANTYQNMAAGGGPSLATQTAQQQGQAGLAGTESMLGSARGAGDPAAAQLAARNAQAQTSQNVAQNATIGRTNEELGALGAAGGLYGNVAGQGLQSQGLGQANNQFNAGQTNQVGLANQSNNLTAQQNYLQALEQQNQQQQQGQIQGQQLGVQNNLGLNQIQSSAFNNSAAHNGIGVGLGIAQAGASALGSAASMFV